MDKHRIPKKMDYNERTGKDYEVNVHWVDPLGKSPKETLYAIYKALDRTYGKYDHVDELLWQAQIIIHQNVAPKNNIASDQGIGDLRDRLGAYYKLASKKKKDELLKDVIKEGKSIIDRIAASSLLGES